MPPITLRELEKRAILQAMERHHGDKQAVAVELGISLQTIYSKLASYQQTTEAAPLGMPLNQAQRVAKEAAWHLQRGDPEQAKLAIEWAWKRHIKTKV